MDTSFLSIDTLKIYITTILWGEVFLSSALTFNWIINKKIIPERLNINFLNYKRGRTLLGFNGGYFSNTSFWV